jgi:hypothetical protein
VHKDADKKDCGFLAKSDKFPVEELTLSPQKPRSMPYPELVHFDFFIFIHPLLSSRMIDSFKMSPNPLEDKDRTQSTPDDQGWKSYKDHKLDMVSFIADLSHIVKHPHLPINHLAVEEVQHLS